MQFNLLTGLLALGALASHVSAKGINCDGSSRCFKGALSNIKILVDQIDNNRMYGNGYHIACVPHSPGAVCAFLQNSDHQVSAGVVKELVGGLLSHGCKGCGSNPVYNYGSTPSNDPQWGILTVNYVADSNNPCNGVC